MLVCRSLHLPGAAKALTVAEAPMEGAPAAAAASMGAEARMEEVLTEAAASKAEDALASAGADIPTVALAAEHRCHPLTWAGGK